MAELRELVKKLADEPTQQNQVAFYEGFINSQVAVPTKVPISANQSDETQTADANSQWAIPTTTLPDGSSMLLVFADPRSALRTPEAKGAFGIAGKVVLEIAATNRVGIIVSCSNDSDTEKPSWAGIPHDHVSWILNNSKSK